MTKDQAIALLTFFAGVLALAATQSFVSDAVKPWLIFGVGVINLALTAFFGAVKPIATALLAGRAEGIAAAKK
jgi:hypothetical protein